VDTANSNVAVVVIASSCVVYEVEIDNTVNAAQAEYVKFYNSNAAVTVGVTVPDVIFYLPQNTKRSFVIPEGLTLGTGLQIATVTAGGTAGAVAPTAPVPVRVVYA
jgi:hypothetical protein